MTKKEELCLRISQYDKDRITKKDIIFEAFRIGLKKEPALLAWENFIQTSQPDRRALKQGKIGNFISDIKKYQRKDVPTKQSFKTKKEIAEILLTYMQNTSLNSRDIAKKFNITLRQFYSWVKELNLSGTILGKRILNPLKYHKCEVKDVIWLKRFPETKRSRISNLNILELSFYKRTGNVLEKYLQKIK